MAKHNIAKAKPATSARSQMESSSPRKAINAPKIGTLTTNHAHGRLGLPEVREASFIN
jgi:hypothetical protein